MHSCDRGASDGNDWRGSIIVVRDACTAQPVHRRKWSDEDKARIGPEIVASGDSVCSVGSTAWIVAAAVVWVAASIVRSRKRSFRGGRSTVCARVVDAVVQALTAHRERRAMRRPENGIIAIEVDGITIRAGSIVRALKASR